MADNAKNENYEKAIQWATKYLEEHTEPREVRFKQGVICNSDIDMVRVSLSRLTHAKGRAQQASYNKIRDFKIYLSQNLT
jgi:hypothetical protein